MIFDGILVLKMVLFIDQLDIWLMTLGVTMFVSAFTVYVNTVRTVKADLAKVSPVRTMMAPTGGNAPDVQAEMQEKVNEINRMLSPFYIFIGVYALVSGLWASFTWPLPGPYNIVFSDAWPIFGLASLMVGLASYARMDLKYVTIPLALLGIIVAVYGADIGSFGLTLEPAAAVALYLSIAIALWFSPIAFNFRGSVGRVAGMLSLIFLVTAGILAFYIGGAAAFEHTAGWAKWVPFYG